MTIEDFADFIHKDLVIRRFCNQDNRHMAHFENAEIKSGGVLIGEYGTGKSPYESIENYIKSIRGKHIVFNAMMDDREEFDIPENLS